MTPTEQLRPALTPLVRRIRAIERQLPALADEIDLWEDMPPSPWDAEFIALLSERQWLIEAVVAMADAAKAGRAST